MSTFSKVDAGALGWVKTEIDGTLKQAHTALEEFIENPSELTRLRFCVTHLHQVVGTLRMVELDGAALLAVEIELLADAVADEEIAPTTAVLEALTHGVLGLPEYLARLHYGHADMPLAQLSLINELRAARGVEALSEFDLFTPDLSVRPPRRDDTGIQLSSAEYCARARELRPQFQAQLLAWLRASGDTAPLAAIAGIFDELEARANLGAIEQLFWVAGGLVETLIDGGLNASGEAKKHLTRIDQLIKRIVDGADKTQVRTACEARTRAMLFDLARAATRGPKAVALRRAFALDAWLSANDAASEAQTHGRPTPEALESVARVLAKEIEQAQDLLASAVDPKQPDIKAIEPLLELLRKMGGTLDMVGIPALKALIDELSTTCRALLENRIADTKAAAMPMAQALILIESGARDIQRSESEWQRQIEHAITMLHGLHSPFAGGSKVTGIEVVETELTDFDRRQLLGVIGAEIGVNLGKIEEALEAFAARAAEPEHLNEVPKHLAQIQGALAILGLDRAVAVVNNVQTHIDALRERRLTPTAAVLDALAVCIGTVAAYMDGLRLGRRNVETQLESALTEMSVVVAGVSPNPQVDAQNATALLAAFLAQPADGARQEQLARHLVASPATDKARHIAAEVGRLLDLVAQDPQALTEQVIAILKQSCAVLDGSVADVGTSSTPAAAPAPKPPLADPARDEAFDQEILKIFIEDAHDVRERVAQEYAHWRADPDNSAALTELRRGYHTLKGSGRMVGATRIAEFAWAIENILNYVRDGKIEATPAVFELLDRAQAAVPALIGELEGKQPPGDDVEQVRDAAWTLVGRPGSTPAPPPPSAVVSSTTKVDSALLEIFTNEARGHVATIRLEIAQCRAAGGHCAVTTNLTRAIHTLQGNARSLALPAMAEACAEVEKLLHAFSSQTLPLAEAHLALLEELAAVAAELIERLNQELEIGDLAPRFSAIARVALHEHHQALVSDAVETGAPVETEIKIGAPSGDSTPTEAAFLKAPGNIESLPAAVPPASTSAAPIEPAMHADAIDTELLAIFQEEAVDILETIEQALHAWRREPGDRAVMDDLKRALHTLKGGARMAGAMVMGELAHNMETLLQQIESGKIESPPELLDLLDETHDMLVQMLNQLARGSSGVGVDALSKRLHVAGLPAGSAQANSGTAEPQSTMTPVAVEPAPPTTPPAAPGRARKPGLVEAPGSADIDRREPAVEIEAEALVGSHDRRGQVRVSANLLNTLVNHAGEVSIARARMEQKIYSFRDSFSELSRNVTRFREQLRELEIQSESQILYQVDNRGDTSGADDEFDPLELDRYSRLQQLARGLGESLHDLTTIQMSMGTFVGEAETVLAAQARVNTELQEGLMRTRMVEFGTQAARLRHIARTTARELGKRVELTIEGGDVAIDRTVLDRMIGPFEHMIRNSLDHGIEAETERARQGKPAVGNITIATAQKGNEIVIRFSDDGAGLDIDRIRAKAIERGLMTPDATLSDDALIQFILVAGFSTAERVTHVSGRGVGMDVVHSEVKQLGGSMAVDTQRGAGTSFVIHLPLTLSITQALMAHVGDQIFAVPIAAVDNIVECPIEQLNQLATSAEPRFVYQGESCDYVDLAARLGIVSAPRGRKVPVLLVRHGAHRVAFRVDGLGGTREIVIKPLGLQLVEIRGLSGATIMGDGRVILILDLIGLVIGDGALSVEYRPAVSAPAPTAAAKRRTVMVVDDSLTVRKVTGKHLQKRGLDVMVAKDGIDAVEQLNEHVPDVMLVDIEMPRMDGYELTTRVRGDERLKHIPIIMITSRAGAKHRERAFELGVDKYMSKPYQEDELFANVDELLAQGRA